MNISEIAGVGFSFELGGDTFKAKRLSISDIFGYFEEKVKEQAIKDAKQISEMLPLSQRNTFLIEAWKKLPNGEELSDMVTSRMTTIDGMVDLLYLATRNQNDDLVTPDTFSKYINNETLPELASIITRITGMGDIVDDTDDTDDAENSDKKK